MKYIIIWCFVLMTVSSTYAQTLTSKQNEKGLYGFTNGSGDFVIKPRYDKVHFDFYKGIACVVKGKKYVFINTSGKEISKSYSWASYFDDNDLCLVNAGGKLGEEGQLTGGKYGYVDLKGEERIAVRYARIGDFNEQGVALVNEGGSVNKYGDFEGGKNGFVHTSGKILIAPKYTIVGELGGNGLAWVNIGGKYDDYGVCVGGKFGYVDKNGIEVVAPKYDFIGPVSEDGFCWINKGGKIFKSDKRVDAEVKAYAAKEKDKKKVALFREAFENELLGGKRDVLGQKIVGGKFGFADLSGREIVPVKYAKTSNAFVEGVIWAGDKKYGFVDDKGREITKFVYNKAFDFYNGVAKVMISNKKKALYGLVNKQGREITPIEYEQIGDMNNGFTYVKTYAEYIKKKKSHVPSKYGFIDETGKLLTEIKYDGIGEMVNGIAVCREGKKIGCINNTGKEITPFNLLEAKPFQDGVIWIKLSFSDAALNGKGKPLSASPQVSSDQDGLYGLIDRNGVVLTDFVYKTVRDPHEGVIAVNSDGKYGWIDVKGECIIPLEYSGAGDFHEGVAPVKQADKWGYIDKEGQITVPCKYEDVSMGFLQGVAGAKIGNLFGGIDKNGKVIVPFKLSSIEDLFEIYRSHCTEEGYRPITERDIEIYYIHKKNLAQHFNIITTIPAEYWDY